MSEGTMLATLKLNRRHKAVLFITLLGVGIALMAGEGIEIAVGIAFVGAALAWAVGSNSRIVHGAFLAAGLLLFCGGIIIDRLVLRLINTLDISGRSDKLLLCLSDAPRSR